MSQMTMVGHRRLRLAGVLLALWLGGRVRATAQPEGDSRAASLRLLLSAKIARGIDAVVAQRVVEVLQQPLRDQGYAVLPSGQSPLTAPEPADLFWRSLFALDVQRGLQVYVWADAGRYLVEVTAVSADGDGPWTGRSAGSATTLLSVVQALAVRMLPVATQWDAEAARGWAARIAAERVPAAAPEPTAAMQAARLRQAEAAEAERRRMARRYQLALQLESGFGVQPDFFYTQQIGARFDWRANPGLLLGVYLGYANLPGRFDRAHSLLSYGQLEYRVYFSRRRDLSMPLRVAGGYLVNNGGMLRTSAGLNLPVGKRFELGMDLLAPTFWFVGGGPWVSMNVALEAIVRL